MSYCDFLSKGVEIVKQACALDNEKNYEQAVQHYALASDYFLCAVKYESNPRSKEAIRAKIKIYLDRAEILRTFIEDQRGAPQEEGKGGTATAARKPVKKAAGAPDSDSEKDDPETARLKDSLKGVVLTERPNVLWDDVGGLEGAKEALQEAVVLPEHFPRMFSGSRKPWSGILLYGPPGTGKSFLAKAVATEAKSTFYSVSSSNLMSRWMGDSERLVRGLFELARATRPSVIFIDEIDALCSARSSEESESSRRVKNEFLVQLGGVGNDTDGVLLLAATNLPWVLDQAVRRRFQKRVYIPLPSAASRATIFESHVKNDPLVHLAPEDYRRLAELTEGYSGSDISVVVRDALMVPVRKVHRATHFKAVMGASYENPAVQVELLTPCSPGDVGAREMNWRQVKENDLLEPPITVVDFERSIASNRPSVNLDDLGQYEKFTRDYGQDS